MKKVFLSALFVLVLSTYGAMGCVPPTPPQTVDYVDLDRYLGTWYEIAKIPNIFQTGCLTGQGRQ